MVYWVLGGDVMRESQFDRILVQIAEREHVTVQEVRDEMQAAIEEAQQSSDPAIQALWASIPRKGTALTLEEFISYMANKADLSIV